MRAMQTAALVAGLAAAAATGSGQAVTIDMTNVPLVVILDEVAKQTGHTFLTDGSERAIAIIGDSLRLTDGTVDDAIAALTRRSGLEFVELAPGTHRVYSDRLNISPEVPQATAGDYTVAVSAIDLTLGGVSFLGGRTSPPTGVAPVPQMAITLLVAAPDETQFASFVDMGADVTITDDVGGEWEAATYDGHVGRVSGVTSDYTSAIERVVTSLPSPKASSISIEGELIACGDVTIDEVTLAWGSMDAVTSAGGVRIEPIKFEVDGSSAELSAAIYEPWPNVELTAPATPMGRRRLAPLVRWTSGRRTFGVGPFMYGTRDGRNEYNFILRGITGDIPLDITCRLLVPTNGYVRVPFKIENVPLPEQYVGVLAERPEGALPALAHVFAAKPGEGGRIQLPLTVSGRPYPPGVPVDVYIQRYTGNTRRFNARQEAPWIATTNAGGNLVMDGVIPDRYTLTVQLSRLPRVRSPEGAFRLENTLGIDFADYSANFNWRSCEVRAGSTVELAPLGWTPELRLVRPAIDGEVPKGDLLFEWHRHPEFGAYRVSLMLVENDNPGRTFWVSDVVNGTELNYDPQTGNIESEDDRDLLDLEIGRAYTWGVTGVNAEGLRSGGTFLSGKFTVR
ncbi:MAG TPA: hypothetical protein QGH10_26630 [Armatimonadota bacterium]|nr:hypothetical protein [Armatimonadota bacterium]